MLRHVMMTCLTSYTVLLAQGAQADAECQLGALPQSDRSPQLAAAAKALRATNPCKQSPGLTPRSLVSVWNSLLSNKKLGGRRLDTEPPGSLPQGTMLAEQRVLRFDFGESAAEGLVSVRIEVDGKPLLDMKNPPLQLDVPVDRLTPDQTIGWTLVTRSASYHAQANLMAAAERGDIERKLAHLAGEPVDAVTRLIYKAAIFDEADLFSERDRTFLEIRRLTGL